MYTAAIQNEHMLNYSALQFAAFFLQLWRNSHKTSRRPLMEVYHFQHFQRKNLYLILVYTLNLSLATISSQIQPNLSMRSPLLSSHMYLKVTFCCPVIEHFTGHQSYKTTFSLSQSWPLDKDLTVHLIIVVCSMYEDRTEKTKIYIVSMIWMFQSIYLRYCVNYLLSRNKKQYNLFLYITL